MLICLALACLLSVRLIQSEVSAMLARDADASVSESYLQYLRKH